jgi:hypothetical protein
LPFMQEPIALHLAGFGQPLQGVNFGMGFFIAELLECLSGHPSTLQNAFQTSPQWAAPVVL